MSSLKTINFINKSQLLFLPLFYLQKTDVGRRGLWLIESIPSVVITHSWYMKPSCLFSICLPFQLFAYFYENFCIEKFISDMVHRFQWDQLRKMHFEIVFNLFLHQVGIPGPSQTQSNIQIFFMSLSGRHCSHPKYFSWLSKNTSWFIWFIYHQTGDYC